ncbi:FtsX-like permease family protein [Chondrinema litorale]|uniref:FtsX-like permease family protein n=1 Tax=Chondrinema litorale TaxID=2994555 RepID=UPI0025432B18|nr:FtsX-like permease family protein [Chondrinema litorale]UZR99910.1 permease prefix domain 2-containing transporter [Chondrinema litorale]
MKKSEPPKLAEKLLQWFCSESLYDEISGDLFELYQRRAKKMGKPYANWFYWFNVLMFCRPWVWKQTRSFQLINSAMFSNYVITSLRILFREKLYTTINLSGFIVGISSFLLCFLYVSYEFSYDQFLTDKEKIFRLDYFILKEGQRTQNTGGPVPLAATLNNEVAGIDDYVRIWSASQSYIASKETYMQENEVCFVDKSFFEVFSLPLLFGEKSEVLAKPNSIVLSKHSAQKYFGEVDPIGKILKYKGYPASEMELVVTGVMDNFPENTHLKADMLISLEGVKTEADNWGSFKPVYSYFKLSDVTQEYKIESLLPAFKEKYLADRVYEDNYFEYDLINVADIHLSSRTQWHLKPGNSLDNLILFSCIGAFILLLACINYINLSAAGSISRSREIGIRKTLGAKQGQLVLQYLSESLLISFIATILAVILTKLAIPYLEKFAGITIFFDLKSIKTFSFICITALSTGLLSGLYPALIASKFQPVKAIKNKVKTGASTYFLRKGLVAFQFLISICLIGFTLIINKQIDFILNHDLGFNKEQVVVIPYGDKENESTLLNALDEQSFIKSVSISQSVPAYAGGYDGRLATTPTLTEPIQIRSIITDKAFADTYQLELIEGRNFVKDMQSDTGAVLLNTTAVEMLGFKNASEAIGKKVRWSNYFDGYVIGVVNDFHLGSFREKIAPVILLNKPHWSWWKGYLSIKMETGSSIQQNLETLETIWKTHQADINFRYFFTDKNFESLHQQDLKFRTMSRIFSAIAILLACSGLLGITSYQIKTRSREIAVRKVFGAETGYLFLKLNKEIFLVTIFSFIVAIPILFMLRANWMSVFAYQVEIDWWNFILAGILAVLLAVLVSAYHIYTLANTNPVKIIKNE